MVDSQLSELSAGRYSFAAKMIFTQWNVTAADSTFVQINRIPVELCVCRKDLKFNAILNHSDWGIINEPKCDPSYMFFDNISSFGRVDRWLIMCPKFDLVFLYERRENASFSAK